MMYYKTHMRAVEMVNNYKPQSKNDNLRLACAISRLTKNAQDGFTDAGIAGKIFEILHRPSTSRLIDVTMNNANRQTCDARATIWGKSMPIEIKYQGGRLGHLLDLSPRARDNTIILYYGCIELTGRKNKPDALMEVKVVSILSDFLRVLDETPKSTHFIQHSGYNDREPAIQMTQKTLRALMPMSVDYIDRNNLASYF